MPLFPPRTDPTTPLPLLNSASPWATTERDLEGLFDCPFTDAVTTRTCTLDGYPDDPLKHQVAFFGENSSINSFGFSPYPLSKYLEWLKTILQSNHSRRRRRSKQIIISIGPSTNDEFETMLILLGEFARELNLVVGVELNASCPNLNGSPPPAYSPTILKSYLDVFSRFINSSTSANPSSSNSPLLKLGLKLPPYTYEQQLIDVVKVIEDVSSEENSSNGKKEVVSFLTSTNTLGQGLVLSSQIVSPTQSNSIAQKAFAVDDKFDGETVKVSNSTRFAVPNPFGGLAGDTIHQISLGNIYRLKLLLSKSKNPLVRSITLIGVGGVIDHDSVERFERVGADAVGVATALGRRGVGVFEELRSENVRSRKGEEETKDLKGLKAKL